MHLRHPSVDCRPSLSAEYRQTYRSTYRPILGRHSVECRSTCRPIISRYVDRSSDGMLTGVSTDISTARRSTYQPIIDRYVDQHVDRCAAATCSVCQVLGYDEQSAGYRSTVGGISVDCQYCVLLNWLLLLKCHPYPPPSTRGTRKKSRQSFVPFTLRKIRFYRSENEVL